MKKYGIKKIARIAFWHIVGFAGAALMILYISKIFGAACPTYALFKVCCPFCGMTRAHLAALRLDLTSAFYYNPAFMLALPMIFITVHERLFPQKARKGLRYTAYLCFFIIIAVYIVRVCLYGFDFFD